MKGLGLLRLTEHVLSERERETETERERDREREREIKKKKEMKTNKTPGNSRVINELFAACQLQPITAQR